MSLRPLLLATALLALVGAGVYANADYDSTESQQSSWKVASKGQAQGGSIGESLAGPLEYLWSGPDLHGQQQDTPEVNRPPGQVRIESALLSLFNSGDVRSVDLDSRVSCTTAKESTLKGLNKVHDLINSAILEKTHDPLVEPTLDPLIQVLELVQLAEEEEEEVTSKDTKGELQYLQGLQQLERGLTAFQYIVQFVPGEVAEELDGLVVETRILRDDTRTLLRCDGDSLVDVTSTTGMTARPSSPHQETPPHPQDAQARLDRVREEASRMGCKSVQIFYDQYLTLVRAKIEAFKSRRQGNNKNGKDEESALMEEAVRLLHFQEAGGYLSDQQAQEKITQLEHWQQQHHRPAQSSQEQEQEHQKQVWPMAAMMRMVLGAGDALQACQASVERQGVYSETQKRLSPIIEPWQQSSDEEQDQPPQKQHQRFLKDDTQMAMEARRRDPTKFGLLE